MVLLVSNLAIDLVIAVMLCILLGTRRSNFPESRYVVLVHHGEVVLMQTP